ncbi:hypothetical protein DLAC_09416 [Tieghemostelium lacteum]|uniref:GPI transamidase component PIG-T n=1 Tax=Tieghemostelium lacteum TaxID=361077 RepID=A0A151ZA24_TIELA|nr:hypothetical protein DLAC_09416 [Tieghemostelium lacteum]|eukprot:KYQ90776.1 hypothetical protein DLAC_09416 [Tieghemostelium lacteum]
MKWIEIAIYFVFINVVFSTSNHIKFNESQSFYEEMILKPLPKGKLMTHVQFTTEWKSNFFDQSTFQHYDLFPRSIGDLINRVGIEELELVFTQGRWNYAEWGYPVRASPVGVELVAWLKPLPGKDIDAQWRELTHSLSGFFCASMQFLHQVTHHTSSPNRSFRPDGKSNIYYNDDESITPGIFNRADNTTTALQLRYGILPRESVCTENLTPWIKLLPCREQSGIGKLLNPLKLYDVHYHSMTINIRKICKPTSHDCLAPSMEIIQSLTVVNDVSSFTNKETGRIDLNIDQLFGKITSSGSGTGLYSCPLASESRIYIPTKSMDQYQISLIPASYSPTANKQFTVFNLKNYSKSNSLKLNINWLKNPLSPTLGSINAPVVAHSHLTGYGQERGGLAIQIFNYHHSAINITYYQAIPWYLRIYFHTFSFMINDKIYTDRDLSYHYIMPAETRSSPSTLELSFELPPNSVASMSIDFDKVFLHYTEHPPDANRGFDLGSGVVTCHIQPESIPTLHGESIDLEWSPLLYTKKSSRDNTTIPVRIYTEGLLITLPTPDFSMLYNVITLTSTVFALFFGSMINILIRRLKDTFNGQEFVSDRPIAKIYRKLMSFVDGTSSTKN